MHSEVGTIYYVAPEVLSGDYTDKADIWSIGVVTYVLLCGFPPFNAGNESLTYNVLAEGAADVKFPSPAWDRITPDAISFIRKLLNKDPDQRPSAKESLEDNWLSNELVTAKKNWRGTFLPKNGQCAKQVPSERQVVHVEKQRQNAFHRILNQRRNRKDNNKHHQHQHQHQESNNNNVSEHVESSSSDGVSSTSSLIKPQNDNSSHRRNRRTKNSSGGLPFGKGQLIDKMFNTNISGRNDEK